MSKLAPKKTVPRIQLQAVGQIRKTEIWVVNPCCKFYSERGMLYYETLIEAHFKCALGCSYGNQRIAFYSYFGFRRGGYVRPVADGHFRL